MTEQQEPYSTLFGNASLQARGLDATRSIAKMIASVYNTLRADIGDDDHALVLCAKWMEVWPEWSMMMASIQSEEEPK